MADSKPPIIVWFRRELRLSDHAALRAAADADAPILPLYILDDETPGDLRIGGASRWWLHGSLQALNDSLDGNLCLRKGAAKEVIAALLDETGASAIHATQGYLPWDTRTERGIADHCKETSAAFHLHPGRLLFAPGAVATSDGSPYKVFSPFWKACLSEPEPCAPVKPPKLGDFGKADGEKLKDLDLLPSKPDWAGGLRDTWEPGEDAAKSRLTDFIDKGLEDYADDRSNLFGDPTSRLSPHIQFGEISPNQIWHAVRHAAEGKKKMRKGAETFLKELGWREFSYHLLYRYPDMPETPLREEFGDFPWRQDKKALRAWQQGKTGYPVVDAAMRELWQTGWMANRARMIVASFLVKHLLLPWQTGENWFWDTLVDADLANNSASWQWVAGCGTDAAPYFRVFNPILQGKKFDPDGDYVRRWVPELADLSASDIHAPWEASDPALAEAGVKLGDTYPEPIVEHGRGRKRALEAFESIKK